MRRGKDTQRTIVPLGDRAVLIYLPDEGAAVRFANAVRSAGFSWLQDVVPAYASVGVFFDDVTVRHSEVVEFLRSLNLPRATNTSAGKLHVIPCCYDMQLDLERVAEHTKLTSEQVIALHLSREYTIHAIGFAPGFPYLGYLSPEICGVPRLPSPRLRVEPGSVGLTGKQTGIYPLARPGGWNLIGRTPLVLVDVEEGYFPLAVGDRLMFERIGEGEFRQREGERIRVD
jgi:inhibitor of KinA